MGGVSRLLEATFRFGATTVEILQGDILDPGVDVQAVVSTDDNYLSMGSGVSRLLRDRAGDPAYVRKAQAQCPVKAGTVVDTAPYGLRDHGPRVKRVLHGAVIDYDTEDLPLEQLVYVTTTNCLHRAEALGLKSVLFPALATGAGGLNITICARQMCGAIKSYLSQQRALQAVYIILYLPAETAEAEKAAESSQEQKREEFEDRNDRFIKEANLVLGVPYDPTVNPHQSKDFFGREQAVKRLVGIICGEEDDSEGKRHAVILGGPKIGKRALLDHLLQLAQPPNRGLGEKRRLVRVTFGRVHTDTPASFVYRKLLHGLEMSEERRTVRDEIRRFYGQAEVDCARFVRFLQDHKSVFSGVVFLIDHLPWLLHGDREASGTYEDTRAFWSNLDHLEPYVRFVYTATDDEEYQDSLGCLSASLKNRLVEVRLKCLKDQESREWVNGLFSRYLGCQGDAPIFVHSFMEDEAGQHPYLLSLAGHALIERMKRDLLEYPQHEAEVYEPPALVTFFRDARKRIEQPRRAFFGSLLRDVDDEELVDLRNLAKASSMEDEIQLLIQDFQEGDPNAEILLQELQYQEDPRRFLHSEALRRLEDRGYLLCADKKAAQFMARPFGPYVSEVSRSGQRQREQDRPSDVVISLLSSCEEAGPIPAVIPQANDASTPGAQSSLRPPQVIRTMFYSRGARITTAQKQFLPELKDEFMLSFDCCINHRLHPRQFPASGVFPNLEEVGNYILTQFTSVAIKRHLQNLARGSTIQLMVDDALKNIPWELMLETAYAGEIPFRVGRSTIGQQQPQTISPPVRGSPKIKALLIGDPTDDLGEARIEVQGLADRIGRDGRFAYPDVLIGSEQCQRVRILSHLGSGKYGMVHYSGHTRFDGQKSAWLLRDGNITTDMLTNALQMAPPPLVFSSSCQSAVGGELRPVKYEDQTFDLPSAFFQAGVEIYVGTLWEVDSLAARRFVEEFYNAFLSSEYCIGECLRQAKWANKRRRDRINWLAFILYGDPHLDPGDLFPILAGSR